MSLREYREGRAICSLLGKIKLTKGEAKTAAKQARGGGAHAYRCECGAWHTGHMPGWRRGGRAKRRVA